MSISSDLLKPTAADWQAALDAAGHTPPKAAEVIGVTRRTMLRYTTGERAASVADWELYLLKTGQHPTSVLVPRAHGPK